MGCLATRRAMTPEQVVWNLASLETLISTVAARRDLIVIGIYDLCLNALGPQPLHHKFC